MEKYSFYEQINIFLENKSQKKPLACVLRFDVCVCRHGPTHAARVSKAYERQVFCINVEVWNESHIIWEPFQTLFSHYI